MRSKLRKVFFIQFHLVCLLWWFLYWDELSNWLGMRSLCLFWCYLLPTPERLTRLLDVNAQLTAKLRNSLQEVLINWYVARCWLCSPRKVPLNFFCHWRCVHVEFAFVAVCVRLIHYNDCISFCTWEFEVTFIRLCEVL